MTQDRLFEVTPDFKKRKKATMTPAKLRAQKANSAKRIYVRQGVLKVCAVCGKRFYATPKESATRQHCSKKCVGISQRRIVKCIVCFTPFECNGGGKRHRKTCSRPCWIEAARRAKAGRKNPNYSNGASEDKRRWQEAKKGACELCGSKQLLRQHHVVYAQTVKKYHGDVFDPWNSMTLCMSCHSEHHAAGENMIVASRLSADNLAFACTLLQAYAFDYLSRRYEGSFASIALLLKPYLTSDEWSEISQFADGTQEREPYASDCQIIEWKMRTGQVAA